MRSGQMVADRYRLEELIGSGGMGVVWRAVDTELDRVVAVKHAKPGDGARGAEQLRREARNAARVHHPNAVTLFDAVREDAACWLIMEYLPAESLADILDRDGPLSPRQAARIGTQIADALTALHANGIVHRDVKPGNVLVTPEGVAKLTDFGVSRWTEETLTHTGPVVGTPAYLAPEVAAGRDASLASDVYSLGTTLSRAVAEPGPLGPVLDAMVARRPGDRPSADEARARLAAIAEDTTVPVVSRARTRRPWVAAGVAAAAVVVAGGAWLVVSLVDDPEPVSAKLVMADPRTADPCALTDTAALREFGTSTVDEDYGGFNRCDVLVEVAPGDEVDVRIQFENADTSVRDNGFGIEKEPPSDGACHRTVRWAEPYQIAVTAKTSDPTSADLCAMADAATSAIVSKLDGGIPRRTARFDTGSLFHADACALLDGPALARLPGVDAIHPDPGFLNWECRWRSTTGPTSLVLRFDRNDPLTAADGRPVRLAGRDAFVTPDDGTCEVRVVHKPYQIEEGRPATELLLVLVSGEQSPDELCAMATDLAGSAAARLPVP